MPHERAKLLEEFGTKHLRRPFSADEREKSVGWTDLHYAALLNLPDVVKALVDEGMTADVRLKEDNSPFGGALLRTLGGLEYRFAWREANGNTPLHVAAMANSARRPRR